MESQYLFKTVDSYDTPQDHPVSLLFRLMLKSRLYFYFDNFGTFCRSGKLGAAGKLDKYEQIINSNRNIDLIERCGGHIHLRGLENLRANADRPMVLVGNHMSLLECGILHAICREYVDFSFVVKESLLRIPYFKDILLSFDAIPVSRMNPREDLRTVLTKGKQILQSRSLIIFPQHTRSTSFDPEQFNTIGVKLAKSAGVPVLPFALKTDFISNGRLIRDFGPIHPERDVWFEFGKALEITGNGQEQQREIVEFIQTRVNAWQSAETIR